MNAWPQYLLATLLILLAVASIARHGKPLENPVKPMNAMQAIWVLFTFAAVLGAGGFWHF